MGKVALIQDQRLNTVTGHRYVYPRWKGGGGVPRTNMDTLWRSVAHVLLLRTHINFNVRWHFRVQG